MFATLCGTFDTRPWSPVVTGAKVLVTFHSDNKNQGQGFLMYFSTIRRKGRNALPVFVFHRFFSGISGKFTGANKLNNSKTHRTLRLLQVDDRGHISQWEKARFYLNQRDSIPRYL